MKTIGLTGGIGSGKTRVAQKWKSLGAFLFDADHEARLLMIGDPMVRKQLVETFGEEVYLSDGNLNKAFLIREAFEKNRVKELNKIVHPAVRQLTRNLIKQHKQKGTRMFVKEAALLLDNGRPTEFSYIVVVDAPEDIRIKRVLDRDNIPESKVRERMAKQLSVEKMKEMADFVIYNNSSAEELEKYAEELYNRIIEI
ncbi:MAG: dephospho-CoA kinase [Balneolales bacterium]|nr:dephospho-CoA kinase [Balneolales bacterium]